MLQSGSASIHSTDNVSQHSTTHGRRDTCRLSRTTLCLLNLCVGSFTLCSLSVGSRVIPRSRTQDYNMLGTECYARPILHRYR